MSRWSTRRRFIGASAALSGFLTGCKSKPGAEEEEGGPRRLGRPVRAYGERSPFEKMERALPTTKILEVGNSYTPLAEICGTITPSALHYERHHSGVGSYWPYAPTVWDYINRAMPLDRPGTLTHDQVYSLVAFLLQMNGIIGENDVIDAKTLPRIKMPNRDGFVPDTRPDTGAGAIKRAAKASGS